MGKKGIFIFFYFFFLLLNFVLIRWAFHSKAPLVAFIHRPENIDFIVVYSTLNWNELFVCFLNFLNVCFY